MSSTTVVGAGFAALVQRAHENPDVRGKLVYFPDDLVEEHGLDGAEAAAVRNCDLRGLAFEDEDLRIKAELVFNLHDLFAGE